MKPTEFCKQYNMTLKQVSEITGVPVRTLYDWHTTRPKAFKTLVIGSNEVRRGAKNAEN